MKCSQCGVENPDESRFCKDCGVQLKMAMGDVGAAFERAFHAEMQGDPAAALEEFKRLLQVKQRSVEVTYRLGRACLALGQLENAIGCFRSVVERQPKFAYAHLRLADCYYDKCQMDLAIQSYRNALAANPQCLPAMLGLGRALMHMAHMDEAIGVFKTAVEKSPDCTIAYYYLGLMYKGERMLEEAIAAF
jgi:tetratricopeptide (TPR) repeat protein